MDSGSAALVSSQHGNDSATLSSLCKERGDLVRQVTNAIPEQCTLLAQTIATKFPMPKEQPIVSKEGAISKLLVIATFSQENEVLRMTPVSLEVKNFSVDGAAQAFPQFLVEQVLPKLYENKQSPLFKVCIDKLVEEFCTLPEWQKHKDLESVHPVLLLFIERIRKQREDEEIVIMQRKQFKTLGHKVFTGEW